MADDDSSELSSLSSLSPPPSDDESDIQLKADGPILKFLHKIPPRDMSPPAPKRQPSPPHEYVLADNQDIAFIVMFRNRFSDAFPKNLTNFGPQELERDIVDSTPGDRVEQFLCALLKLLLNRQQDVKPGHYNRALEEAVQINKAQWLQAWDESPLAGGKTFLTMTPDERLALLRAIILWTMSSSRLVRDIIDHGYKGKRQEDDSNIPLSVQPWGSDSDKRRYFLIEGRDDTAFRVYRESNPAGFNRTWFSVAGSIDELRALTEKLETVDKGPKAKKLAGKLNNEIPRFEATEEKRKRREYRQMRKDQFKRPEPGFSLYEGRTRGKRMKYTYSDDEDFLTDSTAPRRSTRNTGTHTPAEPTGPVVTASGRQIRAPSRLNAETVSNGGFSASGSVQGDAQPEAGGDVDMDEASIGPTGRPRRSAAVNHGLNGWASKKKRKNNNNYDSEEDEDSEPEFGDDEEEDEHVPDESDEDEDEFDDDQEMLDDDTDLGASPKSLIVKLPISVELDKETGRYVKAEGKTTRATGPSTNGSGTQEVRRNESTSESSGSTEESSPEPPVRTAEEISVAVRRATPEPAVNPVEPKASVPLTPSSGMALAFRGSPEKPATMPRQIDVSLRE